MSHTIYYNIIHTGVKRFNDPTWVVPWLALLGRSHLYIAKRNEQTPADYQPSSSQHNLGTWYQQRKYDLACGMHGILFDFKYGRKQLVAMGYLVEELCGQLDDAADLLLLPEFRGDSTLTPAKLQVVAKKLEAVALALNNLPFADACNNPRCVNLNGPSERALVAGDNTCSKDGTACYCSSSCRATHWAQHRYACRALSAAKAAAAASEAAAAAVLRKTLS